MAKPDIKITSRPTMQRMKAKLRKRLNEIGDKTTPNKKAAIFLDQWVQKNFQSEGDKVGGWEPVKRKGKILQLTGQLRLSFLPFANARDAGIGSQLPYAKKHDLGIDVKKRQILPQHDDVDKDLFKIYDQHVAKLTTESL